MLREKLVCVQEVIAPQEVYSASLRKERRDYLERFARNGRFFFGTIRILFADGKVVLGQLRSFPDADPATKKQDGVALAGIIESVLEGKAIAAQETTAPRFGPPFEKKFKKDGVERPFKKGFGPKKGGVPVGSVAPAFELKYLASAQTFKLSENFGRKPTVLIFHSFT